VILIQASESLSKRFPSLSLAIALDTPRKPHHIDLGIVGIVLATRTRARFIYKKKSKIKKKFIYSPKTKLIYKKIVSVLKIFIPLAT